MSFLGQVFSGGTSNGTNATTVPTNQNIVNPYQNADQLNQAQSGVNSQLANQQALQGQLSGQNGIGNQSSVYGQEQNLANTLQNQVNGTGPNPAQAQLAQNTATNVANQAALMAGQRGASANPALIARQAAQQGAATQQSSVGQAATLQAQQQIAAQQQLAAQQQQMAGLAGTQVNQQLQNQQNLTGTNLSNTGQIGGILGQQNSTQAGITNTQQSGQNQLNSGNQQEAQNIFKGVTQDVGGLLGLAHGGQVENPKLAAVGSKDRFPSHAMMAPHLKDMATLFHGHSFNQPKFAYGGETSVGTKLKSGGHVPGKAQVAGDSPKNDTVSAKLSPGEVVIPRSVMQSNDPVKGAAQFVAALQKKKGGKEGSSNQEGDFKNALKRAIAGRKSK